jgi:hypothetical protein
MKDKDLKEKLIQKHGEKKGLELFKKLKEQREIEKSYVMSYRAYKRI